MQIAKKKMGTKMLVALILSFVMVMSMSVMAFAATTVGTNAKTVGVYAVKESCTEYVGDENPSTSDPRISMAHSYLVSPGTRPIDASTGDMEVTIQFKNDGIMGIGDVLEVYQETYPGSGVYGSDLLYNNDYADIFYSGNVIGDTDATRTEVKIKTVVDMGWMGTSTQYYKIQLDADSVVY